LLKPKLQGSITATTARSAKLHRVVAGWLSLSVCCIQLAHAETPADFIKLYSSEAAKQTPGFTASAERGKAFFLHKNTASTDFPNCAACHTENPAAEGKHVITSKRIEAMAPAVNPERFTDKDKIEKWFKRNCNDVIGRLCTPGEKADFIAFMVGVKK
jgi:hypothetical protein